MMWNVWVDEWQVQCCGDPFHLGSRISWTLRRGDRDWLAQLLGEETAATVEWCEDHHSDPSAGQLHVEAQVMAISAVRARLRRLPGESFDQPVDGVLTPLTSADGWDHGEGDRKLMGYLVSLAVDR